MNHPSLISFLLILCIGFCSELPSREIYVSSRFGSDGHDGFSSSAPLKTISAAARKAQAGDTVLVGGGIYREQLSIPQSGTGDKPIIFKNMPDETPVVTWGWDLPDWKKVPETRSVYETVFPYAVNLIFERRTLNRYLELPSASQLDHQPGAYFLDRAAGKVLLHPFSGNSPAADGIVAVPYHDKGKIPPFHADLAKLDRWTNGWLLTGDHIEVDGFEIAFHPAAGRIMRVKVPATFCVFRNNTVYGATCGIKAHWRVANATIEKNRVLRVAGAGIQVGQFVKQIMVRDNFLLDNGPSAPFTGQKSATEGHPINLNRYGSGDLRNGSVSFIGNTVISDDATRRYNVMRCKGGVPELLIRNNVFSGGFLDIYPLPESEGKINFNTVVDGRIVIGKSDSGKLYLPEIIGNIELKRGDRRQSEFANREEFDFRLRPGSIFRGTGAWPEPAGIAYVRPEATGDGLSPQTPAGTIAEVLKNADVDTIYLLPGKYRERLDIRRSVPLRFAAWNTDQVQWYDSELSIAPGSGVTWEKIIFRQCRFFNSGAEVTWRNCVFDHSTIRSSSGKLWLINNTLTGNSAIGATKANILLRNNLFVSAESFPLELKESGAITENNYFSGTHAEKFAEEWKKHFPKEGHPVQTATAVLDRNYRPVQPGTLDFKGLGWTPVGARRSQLPPRPMEIASVKVENILHDRALVTWETPRDYPDVAVFLQNLDDNRRFPPIHRKQSSFKTMRHHLSLRQLKPGTRYRIDIHFIPAGGGAPTIRNLTFTTPDIAPDRAGNIYVSVKSGSDSADGSSPGTALKTLTAALKRTGTGGTIFVAPGVYEEMTEIHTDGVTLKSTVPGEAKLSAIGIFDQIMLLDRVRDVTIDGFDFTGVYYSAQAKSLTIDAGKNITVRNCRFDRQDHKSRCSNIQLLARGVDGLNVDNSVFDSGFHGIWIFRGNNINITRNTFWGIGINAIHVGCDVRANIRITGNIFSDVVSRHRSPAVTVGTHPAKIICNRNLYWSTAGYCPEQRVYGEGGGPDSAPWSVMQKDMALTLEEARKRYHIEAEGMFADPRFIDPEHGDFRFHPDSPVFDAGTGKQKFGKEFL